VTANTTNASARGHGRKQRKCPLQEHHILVTYEAIDLNFLNGLYRPTKHFATFTHK